MDELILLTPEKAVRKHFDMLNYKWFRRMVYLLLGYSSITLLVDPLNGGAISSSGATLVLSLLCVFLVRGPKIESFFYGFLNLYLVVQGCLLTLMPDVWETANVWTFVYPYFLLIYRTRGGATFLKFCFFLGICVAHGWFEGSIMASAVGGGAIFCICLPISLFDTARRKRIFLEVWQRAAHNKERLRMKQELEQARDIQLSFLPDGDPLMEGVEVSCFSEPASEVGGDYYDYYRLTEHRLAILVGDVSGHGVGSGLVLSGVRGCLHLLKEEIKEPDLVLAKLNRVLKQTTDKKTFMTMLFLVIDTQTRQVSLANAGHPPLLWYRWNKRDVVKVRRPALPLGGFLNAEFARDQLACEPGDVLLLYSDGLTEVHGRDTGEFGEDRLEASLRRCASYDIPARMMRENILREVKAWQGETEQMDDMTLVLIRFPDPGESGSPLAVNSAAG